MTAPAQFAATLKAVGSRIRAARRKLGLTQQEAALKTGIELRRYQRLEAGEVNATLKTLFHIGEAFGVGVGRFVPR